MSPLDPIAPGSPEDVFYGFCVTLNELHWHVHGLPASPAKAALVDVVARLRELTQGLLSLALTDPGAVVVDPPPTP